MTQGPVRSAQPGATRPPEHGSLSVLITPQPGRYVIGAWDRLVNASETGDVTQCSNWARFRGHFGFDPLYVMVFDGDELVGGAQVLYRRVPVLGRVGYVPLGPVIAGNTPLRAEVRDALARELASIGRHHTRMLFVQPPEAAEETSRQLLRHGFRTSATDLVAAGSVRIDLTASEEQLHANLSKSVRRASRKWASAGVAVRLGDQRDVGLLASLMAATARYRGFDPLPAEYVDRLYRELAPPGNAAIFVGEVHGRPVAAELYTNCGAVARSRLKGFDRSSVAGDLQIPSAITWEAMRWAKGDGCRWFDLGGLAEAPLRGLVDGEPHDPATWDGADRFKLNFGGTAYRYPSTVELIRPWPVRGAYDLSRRHAGGRALLKRVADRLRGVRKSSTVVVEPGSRSR